MPKPSTDFDASRLLVQEVKDYAIFMLDPKGKIMSWNAGAERLKGYSAGDIIGKHFSIFYEKGDVADGKPQRELEVAETEGRVEDEGWRVRKDGTRFWANVVITALHDEKGKLRGFAKVTRDVTERRRAEEALRKENVQLENRVRERTKQLEEANRAKDEFIATLSHELRTPITSMTGWVQMLQDGNLTPLQQRKALEVIDRNLAAQTRLIDDLLNVSRIVAGKLKIDLQPLQPAPLVEQTIELLVPTANAKGLRLTRDLDNRIGPLQIDPSRFHQIIWNLLTNALKFTPKAGHIHVTLKRIDSSVLIQISDSGEGIDEEFLPHVFERFQQADTSNTRRHGGLGVGLTIVKYLVELHGGTISADSEGRGKGATFTVRFPVPALRSISRAARKREAALEKGELKNARILIVEDEADTREMLGHALKQWGARPVCADSAKAALRMLQKHRFDLIISDIGMPEVDGYTFLRKLRALKSPVANLPAIALTAYAGEEDRILAIEAGFNAHLPKPVALAELVRIAGKLIDQRRELIA
jgi:PAS domain S-box-containing protein